MPIFQLRNLVLYLTFQSVTNYACLLISKSIQTMGEMDPGKTGFNDYFIVANH